MALTDFAVRAAKPKDKPYKLADEKGLYLLVSTTGARLWRLKYRFAGREKLLALGTYPEVPLATKKDGKIEGARERRDQARETLRKGIDPSAHRKALAAKQRNDAQNTFEAIAREWHELNKAKWTKQHAETMLRRLEGDDLSKPQPSGTKKKRLAGLFAPLGHRPMADIKAMELLSALRAIEHRGSHGVAHRVLQATNQIFRYAIRTERAERNPAADLKGALQPIPKVTHQAALGAHELPEFFEKLGAYDGDPQTKLAMRLLMLTFVRTGELRAAEWSEIDEAKAEWRVPAERMKMGTAHTVPLSRQALAAFAELRALNGHRRYCFMNSHNHDKYMSENTILFALYRMGYHSRATGHGFRAMARTILGEHGFSREALETQLAHLHGDETERAYARSQYLPERRKAMQYWADYLDDVAGRGGAGVVLIHRAA